MILLIAKQRLKRFLISFFQGEEVFKFKDFFPWKFSRRKIFKCQNIFLIGNLQGKFLAESH